VLAILGNHDECEIAVELGSLGVRMLINGAAEIRRDGTSLWLLGVDGPHRYGCDDLEAARAPVPAEAGVDLYPCGHTHAGQIRLPGIGAPLMNAAYPRSYAHGHWQHGAMQGYTRAGVGCSLLPVRYNCAPEIALIETLKKRARRAVTVGPSR